MSIEIFADSNFSGSSLGSIDYDCPCVGDFWNDQISSIMVYFGTWEFFEHSDFQGRSFQLQPGEYPYVNNEWNDMISSFKQVERDIQANLFLIVGEFNTILQEQGEAVKEFELDKKTPNYSHRTDILDRMDQVLATHGFQDLYVVKYLPKPRLDEYASHQCQLKHQGGRIIVDCSKS